MSNKKKLRVFFIFFIFGILIISFFGIYTYSNSLDSKKEAVLSITFDDGYLTIYENAFPLMQRYNLTGTLYMVVNLTRFYELESRKVMSLDNVLEMYEEGWEIGAHSINHKRLDLLDEEELKKELEYPLEYFKEKGINVSTIAYPYGYYDNKILENVKEHYIAGRAIDSQEIDFYKLGKITRWIKQ